MIRLVERLPHTEYILFAYTAHSDDSKTFDILETREHIWTVRNPDNQEILIDHFHMSCLDCDKARESSSECQGRGECYDGICQCEEGWFGIRCEFHEPCTSLEMDIRFPGFEDTREWSKTFDVFKVDNEPVYVYNRPMYASEPKPGKFDIVVFTGRRWMATHTGTKHMTRFLLSYGSPRLSLNKGFRHAHRRPSKCRPGRVR